MDARIPVTVLTGFLGAGKTSLLEHWLGELPREQTAVIVNEEGEVGIDGALLAQKAARLREITGGCICCVTQQALDAALLHFAESTPRPTRILVETSGAASPSGVIRALIGGSAREQLRLDGVITVLDGHRAEQTLKVPLTVEQLAFADLVLISHTDSCTPEALEALEPKLQRHAPGAVLAQSGRAAQGELQAPALLELLARRSSAPHILPIGSATNSRHGFDSVSMVHQGELDEDRFGDWVETELGSIQARIARIKGILAIRGVHQRVIVQGVGEAIEITLGDDWADEERTSRLVIIGLGLDVVRLRSGFKELHLLPVNTV